jgi:septum formation protein
MEVFSKYKYVLGSGSPRRSQLLREAGFEFSVEVSDADESFSNEMDKQKVAEYLAEVKADALMGNLNKGEMLITADCVVLCNGEILNKPIDKTEAISMLKKLSGKSHLVISGISLNTIEKRVSFSVTTKVFIDELSEEEILYYIDTCKPYDKAGAYGVQEWIGHCKVAKMEGTYTNVMGLPVREIYQELLKF